MARTSFTRSELNIMAKHVTHKSTHDGKAATIARRQARAVKGGATRTNRAGRPMRTADAR